MTKEHQLNCNCYECNDAESTDDPSYYIDSTLIAETYLRSYSRPGVDANGNPVGTLVNSFSPGDTIGKVFSYTTDSAGVVWFELATKTGGAAAEWISTSIPGSFDATTADTTSSGAVQNALIDAQNTILNESGAGLVVQGAKQAVQNIGNSLDGIFGDLKWVFVGIVVIVVGITIMKIKN